MSDSASEAPTLFPGRQPWSVPILLRLQVFAVILERQRVWHVGCPIANRQAKRQGGTHD